MNHLSSYCGLVDAIIRASNKDLPVQNKQTLLMVKRKIFFQVRLLHLENTCEKAPLSGC